MAKVKGFKAGKGPQRTAKIEFAEGHKLHGLEMEVELRVPVGVLLGATSGNVSQAIKPFIQRVKSWNLTDDDDQPIPVSEEAFGEAFDTEESAALLGAWVEAVGVPTPLEEQ